MPDTSSVWDNFKSAIEALDRAGYKAVLMDDPRASNLHEVVLAKRKYAENWGGSERQNWEPSPTGKYYNLEDMQKLADTITDNCITTIRHNPAQLTKKYTKFEFRRRLAVGVLFCTGVPAACVLSYAHGYTAGRAEGVVFARFGPAPPAAAQFSLPPPGR